MILSVNEILQEVETNIKYRILWVDEGNVITYLIDISDENEKALPLKRTLSDLREELIIGKLIKIKEDPYFSVVQQQPNEKNASLRDTAWNMIKDYVQDEPRIFEKSYRTKVFSEIMKGHDISYPGLRKYFRKFWQRGKTPNSLFPDYHKSGARGQERGIKDKKRGRSRKYGGEGINVDEATKKIFLLAIDKYLLNQKELSVTKAFELMLKDHYASDFYYDNGILIMEFEDPNKIPSENQFRYWYQKEYAPKDTLLARKGKRKYGKDHRELLSSSTTEVFGPGARFQIDATTVNAYIISRDNPNWIIGRPVLYLVQDVFSRLVVGMYVGLEGPSWTGAMMAIANTAMDKVKYCAEYGIQITKSAWPCEHLPEILLGDRGELEGYQPERLVEAFNLHLENAAPYRADWKGIVEKRFDVTDQKVKPFLPGYVQKDAAERGAPDYRLQARLTMEQFTKIIIKQVLAFNRSHYIEDYPIGRDMIADDVDPVPLSLWNWGLEHRTGRLRYYAEAQVRFHLLPRESVSVTQFGIRFNSKLFYSCERAITENWFSTARNKSAWDIQISYDPRNMSNLYFLNELTGGIEACYLLPDSQTYEGLSLDEIKYLIEQDKIKRAQLKHEELKVQLGFMEDAEKDVKKAVKEAELGRTNGLSKAERTRSIRENRKNEKESRRKEEAFIFVNHSETHAEVIPFKKDQTEDDYNRPSIKELLRRRKEERE
jgi:hypothetical protein